ncbi:MAG: hypothetical protein ACP5NI_01405, partial [Acetobacteraceae bacterium]
MTTNATAAAEACKDSGTIRLGAGMRRATPATEPVSLAAVADCSPHGAIRGAVRVDDGRGDRH